MQTTRRTPSLLQIKKKSRLSGEDAGRALLICTAESALSGQPASMPENVVQYITSTMQTSPEDMSIYSRHLNAASFLSHQRALADAHAMRMHSFVVAQLKTIETTFATEYCIQYMGPDKAAEAYENGAMFIGYGIESLIADPPLLSGNDFMRSAAVNDSEKYAVSAMNIVCYNAAVELIAEETRVDLSSLMVDCNVFDDKASSFNTARDRLHGLIAKYPTPLRAEKLQVLEKYFPPLTALRETAVIPEKNLSSARNMITKLAVFDGTSSSSSLFDILMGV